MFFQMQSSVHFNQLNKMKEIRSELFEDFSPHQQRLKIFLGRYYNEKNGKGRDR